MPRHAISLCALLAALPIASAPAQDSAGSYYVYASDLLAAEQASPRGDLAGLPERLAAIHPPADLDTLHQALRDRAERWARLAPRAEPTPATGITPCLARNPSASSDCTRSNIRHDAGYDRARNDAAVAGNQYAMVRRRIVERLKAAGVRFTDRRGSALAPRE